MTLRAVRTALFLATAAVFGRRRARRLSAGWRAALAERPELVADLAVLGFLAEPHVGADGAALPALETARREGARQMALAILARAGITDDEIRMAIEEMDYEPHDDDPLGTDVALPERAPR